MYWLFKIPFYSRDVIIDSFAYNLLKICNNHYWLTELLCKPCVGNDALAAEKWVVFLMLDSFALLLLYSLKQRICTDIVVNKYTVNMVFAKLC